MFEKINNAFQEVHKNELKKIDDFKQVYGSTWAKVNENAISTERIYKMINDFRGKYYFLSNFYNAPVVYEGLEYENNEAAFQSAKVTDMERRKQFCELDPSVAKRKGRNVTLRHDWEDIKDKVMEDCVGLRKVSEGRGKFHYDMKGIEAKASLSDFKNGFCAAPAYTYIISIVDTIPLELIPDRIGLIEVNLDIFRLKKWSQKIPDMKGVKLVKKAKKRIDSRFKDEEKYRKWCSESLERIAYRSSSELLFWRNYIEFSK